AGDGALEDDAAGGEPIDVRRARAPVAVRAEMVRARRVERNQEEIRPRRHGWAASHQRGGGEEYHGAGVVPEECQSFAFTLVPTTFCCASTGARACRSRDQHPSGSCLARAWHV